MPSIQLLYGLVRNEKQLQFNLPRNYEESQYIKRLKDLIFVIKGKNWQFDN